MKIAHIIEAGRYGGPNRTIVEICKSLKTDHDFIVISGREDSNQFRSELNAISVNSYFLNLTRLRFNFKQFIKYFFRFLYEIFKIYQIVRKEKVAVIHNHTFLDFKAIIVGRLLNKPVIWHLHSSILPKNIKPIFRFFLKIHRGNRICVSKLTKEVFLGSIDDQKTTIIQSPVDTDIFDFNQKRSIYERDNKTISICCVANFHKDKGQKLLIEAFYLLIKSKETADLNLTLHLKGKVYTNNETYVDELRSFLKELNIENYVFIDSNESVEVHDFLKNKDVFVLASKAEASPMSVWEAASKGIPVICTDVGDVKFFVEKYKSGLILSGQSAAELMELILTLCLSKELALFSINARKMVFNEFRSTVTKDRYLSVYKSLAT
jgi:glycosyltransferase involved in cell wall biosynthesis